MKERQITSAIIYNPASGRGEKREKVERAAKKLQEKGWRVELFPTEAPLHAIELARNNRDKTVVFAAGGDGTLNEVMQGLLGAKAALGCLPMGTLNLWAQEASIPLDPIKAVDIASDGGVIRVVDVGVINERPFLTVGGFGYDGEVFYDIHKPGQKRKRKGIEVYAERSLLKLATYQGVKAELNIDGVKQKSKLLQAWFGNTRMCSLGAGGRCDDGKLDLTYFPGRLPYLLPALGFTSFAVSEIAPFITKYAPYVKQVRGEEFFIDLARPIGAQVDGDPIGKFDHMEIKVLPGALNVLVPKDEVLLFSRDGEVFFEAVKNLINIAVKTT